LDAWEMRKVDVKPRGDLGGVFLGGANTGAIQTDWNAVRVLGGLSLTQAIRIFGSVSRTQ
jgi:hypothetical protein